MNIVLLHVPDCPNRLDARQNLDAALAAAGISEVIVREREVHTPADAAVVGMNGSPTILVDGADLFGTDTPATLACRLYRDETGIRGAPTVDAILGRLAS